MMKTHAFSFMILFFVPFACLFALPSRTQALVHLVEDPVSWQYDHILFFDDFDFPQLMPLNQIFPSTSRLYFAYFKVYYLENNLVAYDYYINYNMKARRKIFHNSQLICSIEYNSNGKESVIQLFKNNLSIEKKVFNEESELIQLETCIYDNKTNSIRESRIYNRKIEGERVQLDYIYYYDNKGHIIKEIGYGLMSTPIYTKVFEYDDKEHIISEQYLDYKEKLVRQVRWAYNEEGLVILEEHYQEKKLIFSYHFSYDLYNNKNRVMVRYYDPPSTNTYILDENGRWLMESDSFIFHDIY